MNVIRCDRCGTVFEKRPAIKLRGNLITCENIKICAISGMEYEYDLCQACLDEFSVFLRGKDAENA